MKAVIIGKSGQLANELVAEVPDGVQFLSLGRNDVDILSYEDLCAHVEKFKPSVLINASAYTAVDKAETDIEAAFLLNKNAVEVMARISKEHNIRLLHVSSDFVFDGNRNKAYKTLSSTNPTGVYGASKLAGEQAINEIYPENSAIIRTSWVYSTFGNNFVKTMLRLMEVNEQLDVVGDQIGCPTYAKTLAKFLWKLAAQESIESIYHWSDAGVASWYDFAVAIQDIACKIDLLNKKIPIKSIPSSAYLTAAKRPTFSLLDTKSSFDILEPVYWREQLELCLANLK
jgi:dTDP-4-dehydrorhamnose reductase